PARPTSSACDRAKLPTGINEVVPCCIMKFCREWATAYPCCICFEDAIYCSDFIWRYPQTRAGRRSNGIGRCDIRIGAKIYIQQSALSTFRQDVFACVKLLIDIIFRINKFELSHKIKALKPSRIVDGFIKAKCL